MRFYFSIYCTVGFWSKELLLAGGVYFGPTVLGLGGQVPCLSADKKSLNLTFIFNSLI